MAEAISERFAIIRQKKIIKKQSADDMELIEKRITLEDIDTLALLGFKDSNLQIIENQFNSNITVRGNEIILKGEIREVALITKIFDELVYILRRNGGLQPQDITTVIELVGARRQKGRPSRIIDETEIFSSPKESIKTKNERQLDYLRKVRTNDIVFAIGPAGTGKTYLAVAMALAALRNGEVSRIVLTRPAVEAGENLGFLPGDLQEKVDPYLRPLMDALSDMLTAEKLRGKIEKRIIEVAPLAFMRGRTLNNSFIILDEAQNATNTQMKMFLTRMGRNSKSIITGDITQIDLPKKSDCGLIGAQNILRNIKGIEFVQFEKEDVVRHKLVADIIHAYELNAKLFNADKSE